MSEAPRDQNRAVGMLAEDDSTGAAIPLEVDSSTGRLKTNTTITGDISIASLDQAVSGYSADITTTAQEIAFTGGDITIPADTKGIIIQNDDADNIVYLGGSTVTSAGANAAYALNNQGDSISFNNIGTSFTVYVVGSAAGTQLRITYM